MIAEIRATRGFEGFLQPPPLSELTRAAAGGTVVVVNVSQFGSQALILTRDGVQDPVPLPGLSPDAVLRQVVTFLSGLDAAPAGNMPLADPRRVAAEEPLVDTLAWLWDEIAGPVMDRLGTLGVRRDGDHWPRVWWCASGLLSFLPLHAAGYHATRSDAEPRTVIDRVISSYIPTIRALNYAQRPHESVPSIPGGALAAGDRVLVVAMPHTPGARDLPGAQLEAAMLSRRLPGRVTVLTGAEATHATVLAALPRARWGHFTCHGFNDIANPSDSRMLLYDHLESPMTVVDVARQRLGETELACLSACSTAQPGGRRLTDEAIHLAAAFRWPATGR